MSVSIIKVLEALRLLEQKKELRTTLLGIGPMSENVVRATLELAGEKDFPAIFIASRNQVERKELGGGYVCGWDQKGFVRAVRQTAHEVSFKGLLYICRDHGGPWQRDGEWRDRLEAKEAMEKAKASYLEDIVSGFDLLHIDPTKDPHCDGPLSIELVKERTVELIDYVEGERKRRGLTVSYEVGTEETTGGLTDSQLFENFLVELGEELRTRDLPKPAFVVGQTGTYIRMQRNVGRFDSRKASELSQIAGKYEIGFKEHNADYLDYGLLSEHPSLGITAANVAPQFGAAETIGYLKLAEERGDSNFLSTIQKAALENGRWRKWLTKDEAKLTEQEIARDPEKLREITEVSGHYVLEEEKVKEAIGRLLANLRVKDPEKVIIESIKESIRTYVDAFNLKGVTSKILKEL